MTMDVKGQEVVREDVRNHVFSVLNQYSDVALYIESLDDSLTLDQLKLDSLDLLEVIYDLEEYFGVELAAAELKGVDSFAQLVSVFESKLSQAA